MLFGLDQQQLIVLLLVVVASGGLVIAMALPLLKPSEAESRVKAVASRTSAGARKQSPASRLIDREKDGRRRQLQDSLKQVEERESKRKKGVPLKMQISRAGLALSVQKFWLLSAAVGAVMALLPVLLGLPLFVGVLSGVVGFLGLPRWFMALRAKRRREAFLRGLADAVDVMVRGLKAGLPITDAMRVIANEAEAPIGPEFLEVVEGQRLGITIDQGLERMFERIPLPEVSFLGIVISIQSKTGGNLSEALSNLSRVLRDRKKMKAKIRSMSQEAKSSAFIIGCLPFMIVGALYFISPDYLNPLFQTETGRMVLAGCGIWMLIGVIIMRQMINFEI